MEFLKKFWPYPFKVEEKNVTSLIVKLIVFIVVCAVAGILIGVLAGIPIIGVIFSIIGSLVELYGFVGIVLCVVKFLGLVK